MSENTINSIITALGSLVGGIIGAYATIQAAKLRLPKSPNDKQSKLPLLGIIIGAIIGTFATLAILVFLGFITTPKTFPPTSPSTEMPSQTIAFSDNFSSNGSYDTNLWVCLEDSECGIENLVSQNGMLNLKRNTEGLTDILSRTKWSYRELASLSGKIKISGDSDQNQPNFGWISLHDHVTQCTISGSTSPIIQCSVGGNSEGNAEYNTDIYPIQFDTWYSVKFDFDHNSNSIRFYLDNKFIGEHKLINTPDIVQISLGMYSQASNNYYIDDILLTSVR